MPNIQSAKKAVKQSLKRQQVNRDRMSRVKTYIKKLLSSFDSKEQEKIDAAFKDVQSELARAAKNKLMKKKTVSRKISRLSVQAKKVMNS